MKFKKFLEAKNNKFSSTTLVVVDIQPAYKKYIGFLPKFINFINNNNFKDIVYFFNGEEMDMDKKHELIDWLVERGLDESKLDSILFVDKSYAFFRSAMDLGLNSDEMIMVLKVMDQHSINDIREMDDDHWEQLTDKIDVDSWREFLSNGDSINFPNFHKDAKLMYKIIGKDKNLLLCGGSKNQCLLEVAYYLKAIGLKFSYLNEFIYGD
jgi:hypothetical protein